MSSKNKLVVKGVDPEIADKLIAAGLLTPRAIKGTTQTKLREITGLTITGVKNLKGLFIR